VEEWATRETSLTKKFEAGYWSVLSFAEVAPIARRLPLPGSARNF